MSENYSEIRNFWDDFNKEYYEYYEYYGYYEYYEPCEEPCIALLYCTLVTHSEGGPALLCFSINLV